MPNLSRNIIDSPTEIVVYYHSKELMLRKHILPDTALLHCFCGLVRTKWSDVAIDCGLRNLGYWQPPRSDQDSSYERILSDLITDAA